MESRIKPILFFILLMFVLYGGVITAYVYYSLNNIRAESIQRDLDTLDIIKDIVIILKNESYPLASPDIPPRVYKKKKPISKEKMF